jgi:hypothetical protein
LGFDRCFMSADRNDRLEASLRELKRRAVHWQRYAAVTGSAMAMMTSASRADSLQAENQPPTAISLTLAKAS